MAKEIGVTEGAIYRHFVSKKEVLSFLLDDVEKDLVGVCIHGSDHDALGELDNFLKGHLSNIKQKKGVSFQIIAEIISLGDKDLNEKAYHIINKFIDRIKNDLAEGIQTGTIKSTIDLDAISILIFGVVQGLASIWTLSHYRTDLDQKYHYLWSLVRSLISVDHLDEARID
jgi:AcrR family transcriptional regulator